MHCIPSILEFHEIHRWKCLCFPALGINLWVPFVHHREQEYILKIVFNISLELCVLVEGKCIIARSNKGDNWCKIFLSFNASVELFKVGNSFCKWGICDASLYFDSKWLMQKMNVTWHARTMNIDKLKKVHVGKKSY